MNSSPRVDASKLANTFLLFFLTLMVCRCHLSEVKLMHRHQLSCRLVHLFQFLLCQFQVWSWVYYKGWQSKFFSLWWQSCCRVRFQAAFSFVCDIILSYFLSTPLLPWCFLPIFPSTRDFSFLWPFLFFLGLTVLFLQLLVFFHFSLWSWLIFPCQY